MNLALNLIPVSLEKFICSLIDPSIRSCFHIIIHPSLYPRFVCLPTLPDILSFNLPPAFHLVHPLFSPFTHPSCHLFIHSFLHSSTHPSISSSILSFIHPPIFPPIHLPFLHSPTHPSFNSSIYPMQCRSAGLL